MILYPGVRSKRTSRSSRLAFLWEARDASLVARSGQVGVFSASGVSTIGGVITPGTGPGTVQAGRAQPRFGMVGGVPLLDLASATAGQDAELLQFPFALGPVSLTLLLTLTPTWTMGASRATINYAFTLGNLSIGTPAWRVSRGGAGGEATGWSIRRTIPGPTTDIATVAEGAGLTAPLALLVTYNHTTGVDAISIRDANGTVTGPVSSSAIAANTSRWAGDTLYFANDPQASTSGLPIRLHVVKLAIGVKTYADMDGAW